MKKNELISVIIPCYNIEQYCRRCIESLVNQTYKNIEIIVVDDGSSDGTKKIIDEYRSNKKIIITRQKNAGLSAARNTGLKIARGKYVCFVDGDDFVAPKYVEKMYENIIKTDSDICACDFSYIDENDVIKRHPSGSEKVYSSLEGLVDLFSGKQITSVMTWNKLYRTELFKKNKIMFPVGKINEDNFTTYKLYYYANRISYIPDALYYYLQRSNSIMGKTFDSRRMDILEAYAETVDFFRFHTANAEIDEYLECYQAMLYINLYNKIIRSNYYGDERKEIFNAILLNEKKYLANNVLNKKIKIMIFMICRMPTLYNKVLLKKGGR